MAYGKSSDDAMREEKVGSGSDFWTPADGESRIRIMPPANEDLDDFWVKTATHFNVGPDERSVPCPFESGIRESCILCRIIKRLKKGDEDEQSEAEDMGARPRFLVSIVDYADPEAGVQVWPCPVTVFRQLKKFRLNEDEYGDMTDLPDGYDIIIDRTGSGINTKYDATPARKNSEFPTKELLGHRADSVKEMYESLRDEEFALPDLGAVQNYVDDAEMEAIYKGTSSDRTRTESSDAGDNDSDPETDPEPEDGDNEPEQGDGKDEPRGRRSRRSENTEEPEEPEEPEEVKAPSKRSRRAASSDDSESNGKAGRSRVRGRVRDLKGSDD